MDTQTKKLYCAYFRVSTEKQGQSGLGLEAQVERVHQFCRDGELIGEFTEVESGKNSERPELVKAMLLARKNRATLVIAKLDRLSRNVHFISGLMDSGVDFVAVDNPHATRLTLHILAAVAENEARMTSERTKAALKALKDRGFPLGSARTPEALERARASGLMVRGDGRERSMSTATADRLAQIGRERNQRRSEHQLELVRNDFGTLFDDLVARRKCNHTYKRLATWLNKQGRKTPLGNKWTSKGVWRLLRRFQRSQSQPIERQLELA